MIVIAKETLDFRRTGLSPVLWLLVPTFSLPSAPEALADLPSLHLKWSPTAWPQRIEIKPTTSAPCLAPLNFRRRISWQVSCYALFKGWLLLSQPPCCLRNSTAFTTEHGFRGLSLWSGLFPSCTAELSPRVLTPGIKCRAFGVWLVCLYCYNYRPSSALPP